MTAALFTISAALSGALHIYFDYKKNIRATYVFKPLVCVILIVLVFTFGGSAPVAYRSLIIAGLLFSMLGDICLMLKNERFTQGLISFLIAHILYISAFCQLINFGGPLPWGVFLVLAVLGFFVWRYLYSSLGEMNVPVIVYIVAILSMCASAGTWGFQSVQATTNDVSLLPAALAFVGSIWFMASDTNLSINKFKSPYAAGQFITLLTYYTAQILIAWSVLVWAY